MPIYNTFITIDVWQYHVPPCVTLPIFPLHQAAEETTKWLQRQISLNNTHLTIKGPQEIQVLRLLRHVREEIGGIQLRPENLRFYFDMPDSLDMVVMYATPDGDLSDKVPGGFFSNRFAELP